jgi:hypothetical protein
MKTLSVYCATVLLSFAWATHQGYAVNSLFGNHRHEEPGQHSGTFYHK